MFLTMADLSTNSSVFVTMAGLSTNSSVFVNRPGCSAGEEGIEEQVSVAQQQEVSGGFMSTLVGVLYRG